MDGAGSSWAMVVCKHCQLVQAEVGNATRRSCSLDVSPVENLAKAPRPPSRSSSIFSDGESSSNGSHPGRTLGVVDQVNMVPRVLQEVDMMLRVL